MIERHVTFDVHPDMGEDFKKFFSEKYRPAMSTQPGFVKVELLREQENPRHYQMIIRFQTAEDASAWRDSPEHKALSPLLKALYTTSTLQVYDVIV